MGSGTLPEHTCANTRLSPASRNSYPGRQQLASMRPRLPPRCLPIDHASLVACRANATGHIVVVATCHSKDTGAFAWTGNETYLDVSSLKQWRLDADRMRLTVAAGVRYRDVASALATAKLALPAYGNYGGQTIVGAMSTATHGAGRPSLSNFVERMHVMDGQGCMHDITRADHDFAAWASSLGALGVVAEAEFGLTRDWHVLETTMLGLRIHGLASFLQVNRFSYGFHALKQSGRTRATHSPCRGCLYAWHRVATTLAVNATYPKAAYMRGAASMGGVDMSRPRVYAFSDLVHWEEQPPERPCYYARAATKGGWIAGVSDQTQELELMLLPDELESAIRILTPIRYGTSSKRPVVEFRYVLRDTQDVLLSPYRDGDRIAMSIPAVSRVDGERVVHLLLAAHLDVRFHRGKGAPRNLVENSTWDKDAASAFLEAKRANDPLGKFGSPYLDLLPFAKPPRPVRYSSTRKQLNAQTRVVWAAARHAANAKATLARRAANTTAKRLPKRAASATPVPPAPMSNLLEPFAVTVTASLHDTRIARTRGGKMLPLKRLLSAGITHVFERCDTFLYPDRPEGTFNSRSLRIAKAAPMRISGCTAFLPSNMRVVGAGVDHDRVMTWASASFRRLERAGGKLIVFGSAGSRRLTNEWPKERADQQMISLLSRMAPVAEKHGITLALEQLRQRECNYINHMREVASIVRAVNHSHVRAVADLFHMLQMDEPAAELDAAMDVVVHVELSEKDRSAPGTATSDTYDFEPFFDVLRKRNYRGVINIEAPMMQVKDIDKAVATVRSLSRRVLTPHETLQHHGSQAAHSRETSSRMSMRMPPLAFGPQTHPPEMILGALQAGYRHLDTAYHYAGGKSLRSIGQALRLFPARNEVFITSKVGGCGCTGGPPRYHELRAGAHCFNDTKRAAHRSLNELHRSHLDLLLLHHLPTCQQEHTRPVDCTDPSVCALIQAQWAALESLQEYGVARNIGLSNYCPTCVECVTRAARRAPQVIQLALFVGMGAPAVRELLQWVQSESLKLIAYSPINFLSLSRSQRDVLAAIGKPYNRSWIQTALRYVVQNGAVPVVVSRSLEHLRENLGVTQWQLDKAAMRQLDSMRSDSPKGPSLDCKWPAAYQASTRTSRRLSEAAATTEPVRVRVVEAQLKA